MKKYFLLFFIGFLSIIVYGQTKKDKTLPGFEETDKLFEKALDFQAMPGDSVFHYCDLMHEKAEEFKVKKYHAWALTISSRANQLRSRFDKALKEGKELLKMAQSEKWADQEINALSILGTIHQSKGEYAEAADYFTKAMKLAEKEKSELGLAQSYVNLGNVRFYNKRHEEGLIYMQKGAEIYSRLKDSNKVGITQINIGNMVWSTIGIDSAMKWYFKAYNYFKTSNDQMNHSLVMGNIALAYANLGIMDSAHAWTDKTIALKIKVDDLDGLSLAYNFKGQIYKAEGKLNEAIVPLNKGYDIAIQIKSKPQIGAAHQELADVYAQLGKFKEAYQHVLFYAQYKDTLLNEKSNEQITEMQARYDSEKKDLEIKSLEIEQEKQDAELALKEKEKEEKQKQLYYLLFGVIILLISSLFIYNRFRVTRKQKNIIEKQKSEVEIQRSIAEERRVEAEYQKQLVEEKNHEIIDSINYARRLQEAILPPQKLVKQYLPESFILYKPKDIVAGDFYWMETIGDSIYFAAADCTGHGVPGAMVSVVCSNALTKSLMEENILEPAKILDRTRSLVISRFGRSEEEVKDGMDISLCYFSFQTGLLEWAGANNPLWIIRNKSNEIEEIKADKQPVGKYAGESPFTNHKIQLQKGDTIYIFTDGYSDQFGGKKGKKYKALTLKNYLLSIVNKPMIEQRSLLNEEFESWRGKIEQIDDVCMIGFKYEI